MLSRTKIILFLLSLLLTLSVYSQSITFSSLPDWGQDGAITGTVSGVTPSQVRLYLFEFIPDLGWWSFPNCSYISLPSNGQFSATISPPASSRAATRFAAYLVPSYFTGTCVQGPSSIPIAYQVAALTSATIPRLAGYSTLNFGGLTWYVKTAPVAVYPGPQFFLPQNVVIDNSGNLHLKNHLVRRLLVRRRNLQHSNRRLRNLLFHDQFPA